MKEPKEEVINWIRSGMDYNEGISLLINVSHNQRWFDMLTGRERWMKDKLAYELCKASNAADVTNWKAFIEEVKNGVKITGKTSQEKDDNNSGKLPDVKPEKENIPKVSAPVSSKADNQEPMMPEAETLETKPLSEYPPVIRRIIYEYASLYQERGKLHRVMTDMPESNAEPVIIKRKEMFDVIKSISDRLKLLYEAKTAFDEEGIIPSEQDIFHSEKKEVKTPDISSFDEASLKKQKKNLQSNNSKDQALLDYQSKAHGNIKNPMPAGPKRIKIESRIKDRNKQIEEIDALLLKNAVKN